MICFLLHDYLPALLTTLAIEAAVAWLLGMRKWLQILAVNLVTVVTHPIIHCYILVVFFYQLLPSPIPLIVILSLELGVFLVEAVLLAYALKLSAWRAGLISLAMNLASYLLGVFT
jgi:hypothetical protein